jgi:hypothetical protein
METTKNKIAENVPEIFYHRIRITMEFIWAFIFFMYINSCTVYVQKPGEGTNIASPAWAPNYENVDRVRYYYFPDIECYYDVWNQEFVYLEDGSWMFGATLPPSYSWFDLNTAFIVLLDYDVFEPWRHFHYYVSHYPRYYYRTIYKDRFDDISRPMRGFNENSEVTVYKNNQVTNVENKQNINRNENKNEINRRNEAEQETKINHEFPERRVEPTRPEQRMEYYGRNIGRPVKVQHNMMRSKESGRE